VPCYGDKRPTKCAVNSKNKKKNNTDPHRGTYEFKKDENGDLLVDFLNILNR
jgi:hypothetical protein